MIIAKIGNTSFKLKSIADAETLLGIANRSTAVGTAYDVNYKDYCYMADGEMSLSIEVRAGNDIVTLQEHYERQAAREEKSRQAKENAATA